MQLRRLQEMGGATLLVSLPKNWIRASSLRKGSVVSIEDSADGGLLIYPVKGSEPQQPEKDVEIPYPSRFAGEGVTNEITAAYLLGYDLIHVRGGHKISPKDRERIVSSIKRLIGLEVVEEDALSITAQFLVDKTAVEPSKIFRRIAALVRSMISDVIGQFVSGEPLQLETIVHRDDEVDRLHFLLVRLIRSAVREPRSAAKFGLTAIDCLDYRVAASSLENAGDYAVELAQSISQLGRVDEKGRREIDSLSKALDSMQDGAVRSFLGRDFTLARRALADHERLNEVLSEIRKKQDKVDPELLHSTEVIERIARSQRDVADLVSPMRPA